MYFHNFQQESIRPTVPTTFESRMLNCEGTYHPTPCCFLDNFTSSRLLFFILHLFISKISICSAASRCFGFCCWDFCIVSSALNLFSLCFFSIFPTCGAAVRFCFIIGTFSQHPVSVENKRTIGRPKVNWLIINQLKEEDSELWFVKTEIYTISIGQSPIRTWSKNPACGAFSSVSLACGAFWFIQNLTCGAYFSETDMHLTWSFPFSLPIHWW